MRAARRPALILAVVAVGTAAEPATVSTRPLPTDVPVLLVPGWLDTDRDLAALRIRLLSAGWESETVLSLAFDDPVGSNLEHAAEIAAAVEELRAGTGTDKIDIVAHSMGGLATRLYLHETEGAAVRRVAFLGSPHHGTYAAFLAIGDGGREMQPGSPFLTSLNALDPVPEGVEAMTVRTLLDASIVPGESAKLPGVQDHQVCCPTHTGLLHDLEVFRLVRRFLAQGPEGLGSS